MMTQDESQIEAQQMSQDEEEEDEDDDDHESESSRESHFVEGANDENDDGIEVEEGEEEEEDDDEDDDEGDDDDDEDQFQELEEAIYRFPLGDNGDDDLDLMIQYPEEAGLPGHNHIEERMRAIHLPLWSDMIHQGLGSDHANVGGVPVGANSHVSPNHPLLMGRQAANAVEGSSSSRNTNRGLARQLQRGFRGYFHIGSRNQNATAPTILQNFLGGNGAHQELISTSLRRGTPLLVDFGYAILDSLENDVSDIDNSVMGSGGRAALSTIPSALVRWNEESRVIDGDSMHDCVTALKPQILEVVEKAREEEVIQRKAKKKKELEEEEEIIRRKYKMAQEEEAKAKEANATDEASTEASTSAPAAAAENDESIVASSTPNDTLINEDDEPSAATGSSEQVQSRMAEDLVEGLAAAISSQLERVQDQATLPPPPPPPFPTLPLPPVSTVSTTEPMSIFVHEEEEEDEQSLPAALAPLSPSPEQQQSTSSVPPPQQQPPPASAEATTASEEPSEESRGNQDVVMTSSHASPQQQQTEEPARNDNNDGNDPGAGPSGTSTGGPDYSSILGIDVTELPEGVDPSFLAALPPDMRMEVIEEQRRLQTIRQRAAQNVEAGVTEVNPEFLAALPPNIQEEVLAQQRIEQQRQAAQANPEAPVDPGEFLQTLPESLRQTILADMEESQIASLPADLAAEAHLRRREMEQQQRSRYFYISCF